MESQKEDVSVEDPLKYAQICMKWDNSCPWDYFTKARKKIPILILSDKSYEEQAFPYLLP